MAQPLTAEEQAQLKKYVGVEPVAVPSALGFVSGLADPSSPAPAPAVEKVEQIKYESGPTGVFAAGTHYAIAPKDTPEKKSSITGNAGPTKLVVPPPVGYEKIESYAVGAQGNLVTPDHKMMYQPASGGGGSWVPYTKDVALGAEGPPGPPASKPLPAGVEKYSPEAQKFLASQYDGGTIGVASGAKPATTASGPPSGTGGGPKMVGGVTSLGPAKPLTFADKTKSVLYDGEEGLFLDVKEATSIDETWQSAKMDARIAGSEQAALLFEKGVAEQETLLAEQKKKDAEFQSWAAKDHENRAALANEITTSKVDPGRFWNNDAGVGRAIIAGIAGIFGVLGAPATGGKNAAVEEINKAIDRDIQAQVHEIETKKAGLAAKQNEYGLRVKMFGDERAARASYMADAYRMVAKKIDVVAQKTSNEEQKLEASRLSDFYVGQAKIADDKFGLAIEEKWQAKQAAMAKAAAGAQAAMAAKADEERKFFRGIVGKGYEKTLTENPGSKLVFDKNGQPIGVVDPAGNYIYQPGGAAGSATVNIPVAQEGGGIAYKPTAISGGTAAAGKVAEQAGGYVKAIQAIERMEEAAKMDGTWTGDKLVKYKAALADYVSNYAVAKGMGAVSDDEGKRIADTVAQTPTAGVGYLSEAQKTQLAAQKKSLSAEVNALGTAYGPASAAGPAPVTSVAKPVKQ